MIPGRIVDLSQPVDAGTPVFSGDGPVRVTVLDQTSMNLSRIDLCVHTGTHMDAPFHFFHDAETIDRISLDRCLGPARLIDLRNIAPKRSAASISKCPVMRRSARMPPSCIRAG